MKKQIIVGTRGSALALVQAEMTEHLLKQHFPHKEIVRKIITTTGDRRTDVALSQVAKVEGVIDKGVFTKELETSLERGEIDLAVHSLKDVPTVLPDEFEISGVLERAATNDILISKREGGLAALPAGAVIGTSSVRRQRMVQWMRGDLKITDIRGNVPTRLRKLAGSEHIDAIILAEAGLMRLGYDAHGEMTTEHGSVFGEVLNPEKFLPAAGQGAVGIETRVGDIESKAIAQAISHRDTFTRVIAEREFLRLLGAGCHTPVGVSTNLFGGKIMMEAIVFDEAGHSEPMTAELAGNKSQPKETAELLYRALL